MADSHDDHDEHDEDHVPLAIVLTVVAGLCTVLGACLVFCVSPKRMEFLSISMAFAAGVMIYVSLVEIFGEAIGSFEEDLVDSHPDSHEWLAHLFGTLCFFGGIAFGYGLDFLVHALGYEHQEMSTNSKEAWSKDDPQPKADKPETDANTSGTSGGQHVVHATPSTDKLESLEQTETTEEEDKHLIKTALITALGIGLHNFPEGLVTFAATVSDPAFGASVAFAIALHNIPEGVAVAMPVYFGTNSKWKALFWAFLSGIAEPIGGLIGYALINAIFGESVYGVLFGFTAGIMVYISFKELLPMARKRDVDDKYTTILMFAGFLVIDVSIILFNAGG